MKILMVSLPFSGHINPLLGIAKALVNRGHKVDFILSRQWQSQIEAAGARCIPYEDFPQIPTELELRCLSFKAAYSTALKYGRNYECLIYEMLFFPGKFIADELQIPAVRLFSTFALNNQILSEIINTGGPLMGLLKSKKIARLMTKRLLGDFKIKESDMLREIIYNPAKLNFIFTTKEFQINEGDFSKHQYKFIGPSIEGRSESDVLELDDFERPIIYISLGSMLNNAKRFYINCIKAFEGSPYNVIISVGKKVNIADFGQLPNNIRIYPFVPQLQILQKSALFITHGGMNSVNEAMHFGVPMIVTPLATDQPTVAKRVKQLNLGQVMKITASPEEILRLSVETINNLSIQKNVGLFREYSKKAYGTEFAVNEIEHFVYAGGEVTM